MIEKKKRNYFVWAFYCMGDYYFLIHFLILLLWVKSFCLIIFSLHIYTANMCMCECVCINKQIYVHICIYTHTHSHTHLHKHTYIHIYIDIYVCMYVCTYTYKHRYLGNMTAAPHHEIFSKYSRRHVHYIYISSIRNTAIS